MFLVESSKKKKKKKNLNELDLKKIKKKQLEFRCYRITAKIDDDMIRYYVDEDLFLLEVSHSPTNQEHDRNPSDPGSPGDPDDPHESTSIGYDVTLIELPPVQAPPPPSPISVNHNHGHVHGHNQHVHEVANT